MLKITLEAARRNAGFTQKEAAEKLGISNKTLGNWENYTTYPTVLQAESLCSLYGVSYDNISFLPDGSL